MEQKSTRNATIDLMRIIACFMVIVNHTTTAVYQNVDISADWFLSVGYLYLSKAAVPIFLMITGYIMLGKCDSYGKAIWRFVRICLIVVIFSLPFYVENYAGGSLLNMNPVSYLLEIWKNPITMAYWYLYLYAGIMLMLPFLQRFAGALTKKDYHAFFIICLAISSVWPILVHHKPLLEYSACVELPLFNAALCTLMLGAYMKRWGQECRVPNFVCIIVFLLSCAFSVVMTYLEYVKSGGQDYLFYDEINYLPIMVQSVCLFLLLNRITVADKWKKLITAIGKCTFGIYLLSDWLIGKFYGMFTALCDKGMPAMLAVVIWEIIVFTLGLLIVGAFLYAKSLVMNLFRKKSVD